MFADANPRGSRRRVWITAGAKTHIDDRGVWNVPKRELVSCLQVLLQSRRLTIANVPDRDLLKKELLNFRVKITAAMNETFAAWREGIHDDLVLAVALAVWAADKTPETPGLPIDLGRLDCSPFNRRPEFRMGEFDSNNRRIGWPQW